jgi:hypothetical protein
LEFKPKLALKVKNKPWFVLKAESAQRQKEMFEERSKLKLELQRLELQQTNF